LYSAGTIKTNNITSNGIVSYSILPGLVIKSSFGYNYMQSNEFLPVPILSYAPEERPYAQSQSSFSYNNISSYIIEPQLEYRRQISTGKLQIVLGSTVEQNTENGLQVYGVGYSSDLLLNDISDAANVYTGNVTSSVYRYTALFGRINYNLNDKYILDLTARRDGSSRFGPENQFHDFWSAAGAWVFSNERFFKDAFTALSFGKLRASFGTTGNDQIGDYQYLSTYSTTNYSTVNYQGAVGLQPNGIANPYLQWVSSKKSAIGLDLGFLKDRILLSGGYFLERSSNQLLSYTLPVITGFSYILENFPATLQNSGLEFSLRTVNLSTRHFTWSTTFNLTIPKNKLVSFPNLATSSYASTYIIGQPANISQVFSFAGVNDTTGVYQFSTAKGELTNLPNYQTDRMSLINTNPSYYGGFSNTFTLGNVHLDIFFQFLKRIMDNYFMNLGDYPGEFSTNHSYGDNQPTIVLQRWQQIGDITSIQRYTSKSSLSREITDAKESTAAYSNGAFVRLKNVSLSWDLPHQWMQHAHFQRASLFVHGQNLLTFTHFKGLDPESPYSLTLPPLRVITFGAHLTL
jgi:TonB-dependent starch-binding outer membrane protein SusC